LYCFFSGVSCGVIMENNQKRSKSSWVATVA
jgi:hypothetical protein